MATINLSAQHRCLVPHDRLSSKDEEEINYSQKLNAIENIKTTCFKTRSELMERIGQIEESLLQKPIGFTRTLLSKEYARLLKIAIIGSFLTSKKGLSQVLKHKLLKKDESVSKAKEISALLLQQQLEVIEKEISRLELKFDPKNKLVLITLRLKAAILKGEIIRALFLLPKNLKPVLKAEMIIYHKSEIDKLAVSICKRLVDEYEAMKEQFYWNTNHYGNKDHYTFYVYNRQGIKLLIEGEEIGSGGIKVIKDCYEFHVPSDKRESIVSLAPAVLDFLKPSRYRDMIIASVRLQERFRISLNPEYRDNIQDLSILTTTPEPIFQGEWYPSDLERLLNTYQMKPNRNSSEIVSVSLLDLLTIVRQVSKVLLYIHDQGYIHRDVKPENIFVKKKDDKILGVLADFDGIAKKDDQSTFGSPAYISTTHFRTVQDDTIALAITLGETILEDFKLRLRSYPFPEHGLANLMRAITNIRKYLLENSDKILLKSVQSRLKRYDMIDKGCKDLSDIKSTFEDLLKNPKLDEAKKKELRIVFTEINSMEAVCNLVCDFIKRDLDGKVVELQEFRQKLKYIILITLYNEC
ncbi:MAG: protein kinase [Chlamydiae bacterium]|nr:protein kinase [Chlamydiota bacterium]